MMRSKYPLVGIHGLSASELDIISKVEKSSTKEILTRLKDAGLQSVPGAGAEILVELYQRMYSSPAPIKSADLATDNARSSRDRTTFICHYDVWSCGIRLRYCSSS